MLRVLHTSDWHLGHTLHEVPRVEEHAAFLEWLLALLVEQQVDALLIAGDVFDSANPPAEAQRAFYAFLAAARARLPRLDIVVIGGNHDSAARLDAAGPILGALGVHMIGGLPREGRDVLWDRVVVTLHDAAGDPAARVLALPYLRPADLPRVEASDDPLIDGVRLLYAEGLEAARAERGPGEALLAMGHCYMTGSSLSELSERRILGGNQHALPVDIFPDDVAYVALGHLHLAQRVGGRDSVRYSGSPIPLAIDEERYRHQVELVTFEGEAMASRQEILIPRSVPILRIPKDGPRILDEVLALIAGLDARDPGLAEWRRPYLELSVLLPKPEPDLRRRVDEALAGKAARLVRVGVKRTGTGGALGDAEPAKSLADLRPDEVFLLCYERSFKDPPSPALLDAFAELVEQAHAGAAS